MRDNINKIIQYSNNLPLLSNNNILLILVYLYRINEPAKPDQIARYLNIDKGIINKLLFPLIQRGLVMKKDSLDKSKTPPFIVSKYALNVQKYEIIMDDMKKLIDICLDSGK